MIVEALYCGLPVVSTDCPSGPAEILAGGKYGALVKVSDPKEMAEALAKISNDNDPALQKERAMDFTVATVARKFKKTFKDVLGDAK